MQETKDVYPEGGYGWVITFASSLANFSILSIFQCFGIILKDIFTDLNFSATQKSLLLNLNVSFGMLIGPLSGVLQKKCGCRLAAILGACLTVSGLVATAFSNNFTTMLLSFGLLTSVGADMTQSTHRLAVNSYFKKKRSIVTGLVMTGAGFAPIIISQVFRFLRKIYTTQQTTLIYAGFCTNLFIAAFLLKPTEQKINRKEEMVNLNPNKNDEKQSNKIIELFDLDLLTDPIFVNIIFGVALVTFSELNFTLLIPFILQDYNLTTDEIATFLSVLGVSDMIFRFLSPYIGNYFTQPSRHMYVYSVILLIIIKFLFLASKNFYILLGIALIMGIAKGFRKVYMWLVIPDYVPLKKLPTASGIDLLARGITSMVGGTLLGTIRDVTGSYTICIIAMNAVTITALLFWGVEALILYWKSKKLQIDGNC